MRNLLNQLLTLSLNSPVGEVLIAILMTRAAVGNGVALFSLHQPTTVALTKKGRPHCVDISSSVKGDGSYLYDLLT